MNEGFRFAEYRAIAVDRAIVIITLLCIWCVCSDGVFTCNFSIEVFLSAKNSSANKQQTNLSDEANYMEYNESTIINNSSNF